MVRENGNKIIIDPEGADKGSVETIREGLISLLVDITAGTDVETDNLCDLAWVIRILKEDKS